MCDKGCKCGCARYRRRLGRAASGCDDLSSSSEDDEIRLKRRKLNSETRRPKKSSESQTEDEGPGWVGYVGGSLAMMALFGLLYKNIESICKLMGMGECRGIPGWPCILECRLKWTKDEIMRTQSSAYDPPPRPPLPPCNR